MCEDQNIEEKNNSQNIPRAGVLIELPCVGEDDNSNFSITEDSELPSFLEQPIPPLRERHLPTVRILNPLYLNPPSPHNQSHPQKEKYIYDRI